MPFYTMGGWLVPLHRTHHRSPCGGCAEKALAENRPTPWVSVVPASAEPLERVPWTRGPADPRAIVHGAVEVAFLDACHDRSFRAVISRA